MDELQNIMENRLKYGLLPVSRLVELQQDIIDLKSKGQLSQHPIFQSYVSHFDFSLPSDFLHAKTIIVIALKGRRAIFNCIYQNKQYNIVIPPNYYMNKISQSDVISYLRTKLFNNANYELKPVYDRYFMKLLAARSSLAKYGRNNLAYVRGMGSYITLYGYLSDYESLQDDYSDISLLKECQNCFVCRNNCPYNCISDNISVIDIEHCLSLYNEIEDPFPEWIEDKYHNSLIGCMLCQDKCPVNLKEADEDIFLGSLDENQTQALLNMDSESHYLKSALGTLKLGREESYPYLIPLVARNLKSLLFSTPR